jgi:ferritin-like metal-binding protein YciE
MAYLSLRLNPIDRQLRIRGSVVICDTSSRWPEFDNCSRELIPKKEYDMSVTTPKDVFLVLLSHVRQSTERAANIYTEIGKVAQDPEIKEALEARAFLSEKTLATLDQCFKVLGEQPVKFSGRLQEIFVEDFRKELTEIQSPIAKRLFVLAKLVHLTHLQIGEYVALVAAADSQGHYGVGVMLETCLADKLAFVERTRRIIRYVAEEKITAARAAA